MYGLLKENTFYLEMENNSLFMKNNFGDLKIRTPQSYTLFIAFLPFLNGKYNIKEVIENINNEKLRNFYAKLIDVLKKQKFILSSENKIELSSYSEAAKTVLFYCNDLNEFESVDNSEVAIVIASKREEINNVFLNVFFDRYQVVNNQVYEKQYITLIILVNGLIEQRVYIYKQKDSDEVIISSNTPESEKLDDSIFELPLHIIEILASILDIEVNLKIHKVPVEDFFNNDYVFDLRLLSGKHIISEGV